MYHLNQFRPGRWHIVDAGGLPVYDNERDGNDKPLVFDDYDNASRACKRLNSDQPEDDYETDEQ